MKSDQHDKVASTAPAHKDAAAESSLHEQAHKLAASCHGDPKKLAAILEALAPAARDAVMVEAQRMFGNQFVMNAVGAAKPSTGGGKSGGVTTGELGGATGGDSHARPGHEVGVHGLSSDDAVGGKKVAPMKHWGSGMTNEAINTGANNRGTFGDDRLNAGRMTDTGDFRGSESGNAGMFLSTQASAPEPGSPAPFAYPTMTSGKGTTGGSPGKASSVLSGTTVPTTTGDAAGTQTGAASTTVGGRTTVPNRQVVKVTAGVPAETVTSAEAPTSGAAVATTTPRDDVDSGRGGPVIVAGGSTRTEVKHAGTGSSGGHVDGGADPRVDSMGSGGGIMDRSQRADGKVHEEGAGNVNWNQVLQINTLVNPGGK